MTNNHENLNSDFELDAGDFQSLDDFLRDFEMREGLENDSILVESIDSFEFSEPSHTVPQPPTAKKPVEEKNSSIELTKLKSKILQLENEKKEMMASFQRRQLDFENYKKRNDKERNEAFRFALGKIASQLFPVVDNLNRGINSTEQVANQQNSELQHFAEGVKLVNLQLFNILIEMGIEPIPSVGHHFDPHYHEAVATEVNNEVQANTITAELLKGYRFGNTVLRPALVKVAVEG